MKISTSTGGKKRRSGAALFVYVVCKCRLFSLCTFTFGKRETTVTESSTSTVLHIHRHRELISRGRRDASNVNLWLIQNEREDGKKRQPKREGDTAAFPPRAQESRWKEDAGEAVETQSTQAGTGLEASMMGSPALLGSRRELDTSVRR